MDARQKSLEVIARLAGKDASALAPEHELVGDLDIDSPKALQLLVELEEALGIEIDDDDAARLDTVGDILDYVARAT